MRWLVFYHIAWSSSLVLYIMISVPTMDSSSVSPALLYVNLRVAYGVCDRSDICKGISSSTKAESR
jgi:hypothetical protein